MVKTRFCKIVVVMISMPNHWIPLNDEQKRMIQDIKNNLPQINTNSVEPRVKKKHCVCYLRPGFCARIYNQLYSLKNTGFNVFFATRESFFPFYDQYRNVVDQLFQYDSTFDVFNIAHKPDVDLFIVNGLNGDTPLFGELAGDKPVVVDFWNGSYSGKEQFRMVDGFWKKVKGFIFRDPTELRYYEDMGYKLPEKRLFWREYCNRDFFVKEPLPKLSSKDGHYHLVVIGGGLKFDSDMEVLRTILGQGVHVHWYIRPGYKSDFYDKFYEMARSNGLLHIHDSLPFDKIQQEISQYDFGLKVESSTTDATYNKDYLRGNMLYRFCTLLEAGIPFIVKNNFLSVSDVVRENGLGVVLCENKQDGFDVEHLVGLKKYLKTIDYEEMTRNVRVFREQFEVHNNMQRYSDFFRDIIESNKDGGMING